MTDPVAHLALQVKQCPLVVTWLSFIHCGLWIIYLYFRVECGCHHDLPSPWSWNFKAALSLSAPFRRSSKYQLCRTLISQNKRLSLRIWYVRSDLWIPIHRVVRYVPLATLWCILSVFSLWWCWQALDWYWFINLCGHLRPLCPHLRLFLMKFWTLLLSSLSTSVRRSIKVPLS